MAVQRFDPLAEPAEPTRSLRTFWVLTVLVLVGVASWYYQQRAQVAALVTARSGRLTLESDDGGSLAVVTRAPIELWYRVELEHMPLGHTLDLECVWLRPDGTVQHTNRYQTQEITHSPWPTHARTRLGSDDPLGWWTVRLSLHDRELRMLRFQVRDANDERAP